MPLEAKQQKQRKTTGEKLTLREEMKRKMKLNSLLQARLAAPQFSIARSSTYPSSLNGGLSCWAGLWVSNYRMSRLFKQKGSRRSNRQLSE